jgi:uncharacterized membrane protein
MLTHYNRIAGQNAERLAALSDGVFAVAMTLLVLDLHTPAADAVHTEADLAHALLALAPRVLVYLMSFITLGIFWIGQQTQLNNLARTDRAVSWIHLVFLLAVSVTPFTTSLMAEFIELRLALIVYWLNIVLLGGILFAAWRCAIASRLVRDEITPEIGAWIERRIMIAQTLYAFGALLCLINTYVSLGFIILVQLNYAIGPKSGPLSRL